MARKRGIHVVWLSRLANLDPDGKLFADALAGLKRQGRQVEMLSALDQIIDQETGLMRTRQSRNSQELLLTEALETCMEQRPLALLLDEAMEYEPEALGTLLHLSQRMIASRLPLVLMLAGTPNLDINLDMARAGSIDRCKDLYINGLTPEATREAIGKPFVDRGIKVDDKALEMMENMADSYPFFTQIVGAKAWEAMAKAGCGKVDQAVVREAEAEINRLRLAFYGKVLGTMMRMRILQGALVVMEVLRLNGGRAVSEVIIDSLARDDSAVARGKALDVFHKLVDRGFIWSKGDEMEAGNPAFFKYCQEQEKKAAKELKKTAQRKTNYRKQASSRRVSTATKKKKS